MTTRWGLVNAKSERAVQILDLDLEAHPLEAEGATPPAAETRSPALTCSNASMTGLDEALANEPGLNAGGRILLPTGWRLLWAPAWWAVWRAMAWDEL